jgi:hypothetical protein
VNVEGRAAVLKKYKDHFKKNLEIKRDLFLP